MKRIAFLLLAYVLLLTACSPALDQRACAAFSSSISYYYDHTNLIAISIANSSQH